MGFQCLDEKYYPGKILWNALDAFEVLLLRKEARDPSFKEKVSRGFGICIEHLR